MKSEKLVLDTGVVLRYLKKAPAVECFINARPEAVLCVSLVTYIELLSYHALSLEEEIDIHQFLEKVPVIPLTAEIVRITIGLRRATRRKLADAVIAPRRFGWERRWSPPMKDCRKPFILGFRPQELSCCNQNKK